MIINYSPTHFINFRIFFEHIWHSNLYDWHQNVQITQLKNIEFRVSVGSSLMNWPFDAKIGIFSFERLQKSILFKKLFSFLKLVFPNSFNRFFGLPKKNARREKLLVWSFRGYKTVNWSQYFSLFKSIYRKIKLATSSEYQ